MGFFDFFKQSNINQGIEEYKRTAGAVLLDVRTPQEYQEGHIPGSKNVPLQQLDNIVSVAKNKDIPLFVYCYSGSRSRQATGMLQRMGYSKVNNIGGIAAYSGKVENKMKVIIVGGVAGGATAAARIRRLDEHAEITVFERSGYISYANCGLPYYIGDVITDPEELTLQTPESFFKRFRINMKIHHEVISIHPESKTVSVKNLENGEIFEENYDKLILSPGAKPTQPRFPGVGIDKLFTLRTVEDTFRIKEYINKNHPKSAVLAGGGFIGLELAENLRELGMDVTIVQRPKQLMNPFDPDMASMIHNEMRKHGIKLVLGYTVEGFKEKDDGVEVLLKDNPSLQADMVVLAIGVTPDTVLAKEAGLELGINESIVVNDRMETSVPDIYAAGDAVQVKHYVTGNDALISLAGPANKQGRIIADNICGGDSRYLGSQGSSVIKVFDMTAATTGINETNAKKSGLEVDTVILSPMSHAGYYPGGKVMTMKVVFEKRAIVCLALRLSDMKELINVLMCWQQQFMRG